MGPVVHDGVCGTRLNWRDTILDSLPGIGSIRTACWEYAVRPYQDMDLWRKGCHLEAALDEKDPTPEQVRKLTTRMVDYLQLYHQYLLHGLVHDRANTARHVITAAMVMTLFATGVFPPVLAGLVAGGSSIAACWTGREAYQTNKEVQMAVHVLRHELPELFREMDAQERVQVAREALPFPPDDIELVEVAPQ